MASIMGTNNLYQLLFKGRYRPEDVQVSFSEISNRKINAELEAKLKDDWEKTLKSAAEKGIKVWDSQTYRLENFRIESGKLQLDLGPIKFSVRVGLKKHRDEVEKLGFDYCSRGLYVPAIIVASDGKYLMGKLSGKTLNERPVDFIGGVMSKDEIEVKTSRDIWKTIFRELDEEINIKETDIERAELVGALTSKYSNVALVFFIKLKINCEEVKEKFRGRKDEELAELLCLDKQEMKDLLTKLDKRLFFDLLD